MPRRVGSGSHLVVLADEPSPKMDSIRKMIPVKSDGEGFMMGEESRRRYHAAFSSFGVKWQGSLQLLRYLASQLLPLLRPKLRPDKVSTDSNLNQ